MSRDGILLLGGGFIGMAPARSLAAESRRVHIVTRRATPVSNVDISVHVGDLADAALLFILLPPRYPVLPPDIQCGNWIT